MSGTERRLAVFLSHRGSLTKWAEQGILQRELVLYAHYLHADLCESIAIFSYDAADRVLIKRLQAQRSELKRMRLLTPRRGRAGWLYGLLGVFAHASKLSRVDWLKTNQMSGSWSALLAKLVYGKPLMLRQGYSLSRRFLLNRRPWRSLLARALESVAYRLADVIVTTSTESARDIQQRPPLASKVRHLPSFVDLNAFRAKTEYSFREPIVFVGRLEPQKNVLNLARACRTIDWPLDLIGTGSLESELADLASDDGAPIRLLGALANEELARRLPEYSIYALPSLHEGLPKSLMEAMACGLVCVGTNIPGITDLIRDGENGYLCPTAAVDHIAATLRRALDERAEQIGRNASLSAKRFSLEHYATLEAEFMDVRRAVTPPTAQAQHG